MPESLYKIYDELARGGVGCIITGFTSIMDDDYYFPGMARLSNENLITEYERLTRIVHEYKCPVIVQLVLGGYTKNDIRIDDLTQENISDVIGKFVNAAVFTKLANL